VFPKTFSIENITLSKFYFFEMLVWKNVFSAQLSIKEARKVNVGIENVVQNTNRKNLLSSRLTLYFISAAV